MKASKIIGILGGTFDPIHYGHLKIAEQILEKTPLTEIRFLPNQIPVHREKPQASLSDRIKMIELAIKENPKFKLDLTEANRPGPSYMLDTLKILHKENPKDTLALILGADVFSQFNTWHRYLEILDYAHLIIVNRPELVGLKKEWLTDLLSHHLISDPLELAKKTSGLIYEQKCKPIPLSATGIREKLILGKSTLEEIPAAVLDYIQSQKIYRKALR